MPVMLHDSGRPGKDGRGVYAVQQGLAAGMIFTPFETPPETLPRRPSAAHCVEVIHEAGGEAFFDPTTHGALVPGANSFEYYDRWSLWPGATRGALDDDAVRAHVERAIAIQRELGVTPIAPTLRLDSPSAAGASTTLQMAQQALRLDERCYVAVAGSARFWASGVDLDAHIGALAGLRPAGWIITATRETMQYPWPGLDADEVEGICRSVHSASLRGSRVICGHGDFAGLPAVAAGADYVGTGWDVRHRVWSEDMFRDSPGVRTPSQRIAHRGLLASLKRPEAERLLAGDRPLSERLVPGAIPVSQNPQWRHHVGSVRDVVDRVVGAGSRQQRVEELRTIYQEAQADFAAASSHAHPMEAGYDRWIEPLSEGLEQYAAIEGW